MQMWKFKAYLNSCALRRVKGGTIEIELLLRDVSKKCDKRVFCDQSMRKLFEEHLLNNNVSIIEGWILEREGDHSHPRIHSINSIKNSLA